MKKTSMANPWKTIEKQPQDLDAKLSKLGEAAGVKKKR